MNSTQCVRSVAACIALALGLLVEAALCGAPYPTISRARNMVIGGGVLYEVNDQNWDSLFGTYGDTYTTTEYTLMYVRTYDPPPPVSYPFWHIMINGPTSLQAESEGRYWPAETPPSHQIEEPPSSVYDYIMMDLLGGYDRAETYFGYVPEQDDWHHEWIYCAPPHEALWPGDWTFSGCFIGSSDAVDETPEFVRTRGTHWHDAVSGGWEKGDETSDRIEELGEEITFTLIKQGDRWLPQGCPPFFGILVDWAEIARKYSAYIDAQHQLTLHYKLNSHSWTPHSHTMKITCPLAYCEEHYQDLVGWVPGGPMIYETKHRIRAAHEAVNRVVEHKRSITLYPASLAPATSPPENMGDYPGHDPSITVFSLEYSRWKMQDGVPVPESRGDDFNPWASQGHTRDEQNWWLSFYLALPGCTPPTDYYPLQEYWAHHAHADTGDWFPGETRRVWEWPPEPF